MTKTRSAPPAEGNGSPSMAPCSRAPQLLILPDDLSPAARVVTLVNPRSSKPGRYFFCPNKGLYEFTKIAAPKASPRSWLLSRPPCTASNAEQAALPKTDGTQKEHTSTMNGNATRESTEEGTPPASPNSEANSSDISAGYTLSDASLLVATPYDPLFLLLPALRPEVSSESGSKREAPSHLMHPASEYFESLTSSSPHLAFVLSHPATCANFESRLACVCDAVDVGDEKMYRVNERKLLRELLEKARRTLTPHENTKVLPPSMETKFVRRALDIPIANVARGEDIKLAAHLEDEAVKQLEASHGKQEKLNSREPVPDAISEQPSIKELLRMHTALSFIFETCVPSRLASHLLSLLEHTKSAGQTQAPLDVDIDFSPLHDHLSNLSRVRSEVLASRSRDDFSRKRAAGEDEEALLERDEKRRKKEEQEEEEKRKKAAQTRAMRDLRTVDVSGMKKMSDFFGRKPAAGRAAAN